LGFAQGLTPRRLIKRECPLRKYSAVLAAAFWPAVNSFALPLIGCPTGAEKSALESVMEHQQCCRKIFALTRAALRKILEPLSLIG
jgi:hypothetical protein